MKQETTAALLSVGAASLFLSAAAYWWRNRQGKSKIPTKWIRIGELSNMWCFPIKSCGQVEVQSAECTVLGLKQKRSFLSVDRVFMVTGTDMSFKTARAFPHMTQIKPTVDESAMTLTLEAPGMDSIVVPLEPILNDKQFKEAVVWDNALPTVDCGDEVAQWLSKYILHSDTGCRLVFYPFSESKRQVRPKNLFSKLTSEHSGAFPDASSYMMLNEASVLDLKSKVPKGTTCVPLQFRPNFVVSGSDLKPYDEDNWKFVRIGEDAIFECVKPCTRCVFTNIDPSNGVSNTSMEPLKTLKSYRQIQDPEIRKSVGDSPVLGMHLALLQCGKTNVGDAVYVSY